VSEQLSGETDDSTSGSEHKPADVPGVPAQGAPESEVPGSADEPAPAEEAAPETGDLVIDAALRDLAETPSEDLDAQIESGEQVQRTLQGRLSDLGG